MSRRNKEVSKATDTAVQVMDAFSNPLYRLGYGSQAPLEATEYPTTRLTQNYSLLNSMYRSEGILQTVIDIIPAEMTREWFTLTGNIKVDAMAQFEAEMRRINLKDEIFEGLKWGRLYGGAIGIMMIKGQEKMLDKPLNIKTIVPGSFKGLMILDRWAGVNPGTELVTDMSDPDFGLPEYYQINTGDGSKIVANVHHSRVVRFTGRALPWLERINELYWGESEVEPIYDDIVLYDNIMQNMGNLTFRANVDTMEVQNLDQLFAMTSSEQQKRFWSVMQAQSVAQSNFGVRLVNKGDQISNTQYTFTGFNYVTEAAQLNLCAKTHIPMTKLFGRSPAGLSSTGEGDLQNYYDIVDGERESKLRPVLEQLLPVLCMSVWGNIPDDMQIVFPPLWTPNATEVATIAQTKASTVLAAFQANVITLGAAQKELKDLSEETGLFDSITDEEIEANKDKTFQDVTAMQDPLAGLLQDDGQKNREASDSDPFVHDWNPYHDRFGRFASSPDPMVPSGGGNTDPQSIKLITDLTYQELQAKLNEFKMTGVDAPAWTERAKRRHSTNDGKRHDHSDMYPNLAKEEYFEYARSLIERVPDGKDLLGCENDTTIWRYYVPENDFVKARKDTGMSTLFKPEEGLDYYERDIPKRNRK